ncbi:MAG: beta-galactosidase trimerization domain-containing protein [Lachnospiraceae bacterium]|nr:beta-galactosidase trimerization domain-containing protein [Lachnospiraceae bacterium]
MVKTGYDEKLREYVKNGGRFLTTFFSGYVDEHDLVTIGGYPGKLRDILGIWVEEEDALPEDMHNSFHYQGKTYSASLLCDLLHTEGAESLSVYNEDFYAGMPVLTKNAFGKGFGYYVATSSDDAFYRDYIGEICEEAGILPIMDTPEQIEVTKRVNKNGSFVFFLNHGETDHVAALPFGGTDLLSGKAYEAGDALTLEKKGVAILKLR